MTGRSVLTLSSSVFGNKRWGGHRCNGDIDKGGIIAMAGGGQWSRRWPRLAPAFGRHTAGLRVI